MTTLHLRPLRADEYDAWYATVRDGFATALATEGGTPPDGAAARAEKVMAEVLPAGLETPGQVIGVLEAEGRAVGRLWLAEREIDGRRAMFIYDVEIDESQRGKGYGRSAMLLAEEEARGRGISRLELNVFGGNLVARGLYQSLGYFPRAISMAKDL